MCALSQLFHRCSASTAVYLAFSPTHSFSLHSNKYVWPAQRYHLYYAQYSSPMHAREYEEPRTSCQHCKYSIDYKKTCLTWSSLGLVCPHCDSDLSNKAHIQGFENREAHLQVCPFCSADKAILAMHKNLKGCSRPQGCGVQGCSYCSSDKGMHKGCSLPSPRALFHEGREPVAIKMLTGVVCNDSKLKTNGYGFIKPDKGNDMCGKAPHRCHYTLIRTYYTLIRTCF